MHPRPTNGSAADYPTRVGNLIDAADRRLKGNLLDNGAFQVWTTAPAFASAGAAVFTADRWGFGRTGFALGATLSRQTGDQAQYCARVQRDNLNASTANIIIAQTLETANSIPYRSKPVVIGFRARKGAASPPRATCSATSCAPAPAPTKASGPASPAPPTRFRHVTLTTSWQTFTIAGRHAGRVDHPDRRALPIHAGRHRRRADYFEIEKIQMVSAITTASSRTRRSRGMANCRVPTRRGLPHPCRHGGLGAHQHARGADDQRRRRGLHVDRHHQGRDRALPDDGRRGHAHARRRHLAA
jgi:hypothetical protein